MIMPIEHWMHLFPELLVCGAGLFLLLAGVYAGNKSTVGITVFAVVICVAALLLLKITPPYETYYRQDILGGMLQASPFITFIRALLLVAAILTLILTVPWLREEENQRFEYPILVLFSLLGMLLLVSSGNFIALYLAIELMSLALYVLAAFQRDSLRATEAGLKYFVLGSLASGMMLFGISLVYGFLLTTDFNQVAFVLREGLASGGGGWRYLSLGAMVGIIFIITGFAFKVSAAPFHMWTPDVYEGAPTPVTLFFATAPKVAGLAIFMRVMMETFGPAGDTWQQIVIAVSVASMLVGAFGALTQTNIKRLLAYSSIGHVGYALMGIVVNNAAGVQGLLIYLTLYVVMSAGMFGCVLLMRRGGKPVEDIAELSGLAQTRPRMALMIAIFLFSMAGIPPLAGFIGKFYIFFAAVNAGLWWLALIGVLASVVSCFYYIKIVKLMYFDAPREAFDDEVALSTRFTLGACALFTLLFFVVPSVLIERASQAAQSLFL